MHAFLAGNAETDERRDLVAELDRLLPREIAQVLDLDLAWASSCTASASITRTASVSRSFSSFRVTSPWKLGSSKPSTSN
jgi:hypothetical protein